MKFRHLMLPGLMLAALMGLGACTDGIFAIIEDEVKVVTSTLPLTITVFDITAPAPGGPYYVAAGGVFEGTLGAGGTMAWNPDDDSRPLNPSDSLLCNTMAFLGGAGDSLWGGFISSSGTPSLYRSNTGGTYSFAASSPESDPAINGKQVIGLHVAGPGNGHLFMSSTLNTLTYGLDYKQDNGAAWTANFLSGLAKPVVGVVFDGFGGHNLYWAASGTTLFTSIDPPTAVSFTQLLTPPSFESGDTINGIFADSTTGKVFLATKKSGIFYTADNGATWTNIEADQVGSYVVGYLCVAGPFASGNIYLVGSDGFGYYTLSISGGDLSRFDDSTISLFSHSVARILIDGVNVFMGTHMNGLWRAVFDTTTGELASGESWVHE